MTDGSRAAPAMPAVNMVSIDDIRSALSQGLSDFARAPMFGLFFGGIFAVIGLAITWSLTAGGMPWLIYPFAIGFPLIGPFAAVGLYDVSRRLESGRELSWRGVLLAVWAQRGRELSWMAFAMLFVFWMWMYQVRLLMALFLGRASFATLERFVAVVTGTAEGWLFLAVGHLVGAAFALGLFSITVVSIPLLLEREVDFITAIITSVRAVIYSPVAMLFWGVVVTLAVLAACLPFFLGLLVVLPVLGHTTWHLYRRIVVRPGAAA